MNMEKKAEQKIIHKSRLAFAGGVFVAPVMAVLAPVLVAMEVENNNLRLADYYPSTSEVNAEYRKRFVRFFKEFVFGLPTRAYNSVYTKGMSEIKKQENIIKEKEQEKFQTVAKTISETPGYLADFYATLLKTENMDVEFFVKTEHQPATIQKCTFDKYRILFGGTGTQWCGGICASTYLSRKNSDGVWTDVSLLDEDTSKFIYSKVESHYKQLKLGQILDSVKHSK